MMKNCKAWCLVFVYTEIITAAMNAITSSAVNAHNVAIYISLCICGILDDMFTHFSSPLDGTVVVWGPHHLTTITTTRAADTETGNRPATGVMVAGPVAANIIILTNITMTIVPLHRHIITQEEVDILGDWASPKC